MDPIIDEHIDDNSKERLRKVVRTLELLEYISFGFLVTGVLFKIQHWPYAFVLMVCSLTSLTILAIIKLFCVKDKLTAALRSLAVVLIIAGTIVKINHYPYANVLIISGSIFCSFIIF